MDTKFKIIANLGEHNWILLMKYIELHEKYSEVLLIFKQILKNFDGQTNERKLKILDQNHDQLGNCYRKINNFTAELNEKFKLQDQSTYFRFKLANHLLFHDKDYDKFTEEQDLPIADAALGKNTYFILKAEGTKLFIDKVPLNFIERTKFDSKRMVGEGEFLPTALSQAIYSNIQHPNIKIDLAEALKKAVRSDNVEAIQILSSVMTSLDGVISSPGGETALQLACKEGKLNKEVSGKQWVVVRKVWRLI